MNRKLTVSELLLETKTNIPFPQAKTYVYQPTIEEISMLGSDKNFFIGAQAIVKNYKDFQDNSDLSKFSNFEILMTMIIQTKTEEVKQIKHNFENLLYLVFPQFEKILFTPQSIILQGNNKDIQNSMIDKDNFDYFANIIYDMFYLSYLQGEQQDDYNPAGDRARAIADKLRQRREKLAALKEERGENSSVLSIFGRYISVLSVGLQKDKNIFKKYSVYQLVDEFRRFQLKQVYDFTIQAKMAGASKVKDAKDWMDNLQSDDDED